MQIVRREDGYWITDMPFDDPDQGPYDTKADAMESARMLKQFYLHRNDRSFFTTDLPMDQKHE
jgi:hypothetical protein